jgi:MoxR-like ATPase
MSPTVQAKFATVCQELNAALIERTEEIDFTLTALIAQEHALLVGPPGCGKSMLLDAITEWCDGKRFSILVNKFTSPEEMFGPVSLTGLKEDRYQRITIGKLPEADFAFVDEVFKGSSAILNSMLKILNERTFDNGSAGLQKVPLKLCLGASNEWPGEGDQGKELNALFDRFLLRKTVKPIASTDGRQKLLWGGNHKVTLSSKLLPAELEQANKDASALLWSAEAKTALETVLQELSTEGIRPGDRRQYKAVRIAQAYAWLQGATEVEPDHLEILSHVLWDDPIEQPNKAAQVISKVSNPLHFVINGFLVEAHNVKSEMKNPKDLAAASAAIAKLDEIQKKLKSIKSDSQKMKDARKEVARIRYTRQTGRSCLVRHFQMFARYWKDKEGSVRVEFLFPWHVSPSPNWKAKP